MSEKNLKFLLTIQMSLLEVNGLLTRKIGKKFRTIQLFRNSKKKGGQNITETSLDLIQKYFADHNGSLENIWFPVRRKDAEKQLKLFLKERLDKFGVYEDAMRENENFLYHSCISPPSQYRTDYARRNYRFCQQSI